MPARRILVVLAVVMGITALSVAVAPPPQPSVQTEPGGATPRSADAPAGAGVVARTISAEAPQAQMVEVTVGSTLRLTVEADALDSVHIEGLDLFAGVAPESPALFDILADRPGSYDVRLSESGRLIGHIEVSSPS